MNSSPLDKVAAHGVTLTFLARELGVTKGAVGQWKRTRIPAEHCPTIERLLGGRVKCEELRPDVEWSYLRGTKCAAHH